MNSDWSNFTPAHTFVTIRATSHCEEITTIVTRLRTHQLRCCRDTEGELPEKAHRHSLYTQVNTGRNLCHFQLESINLYIFSQSFPCSQAYATSSTVSSAHHFPTICTPTGNFVPDPANGPSSISSNPMGKVKAGWPVWLNGQVLAVSPTCVSI